MSSENVTTINISLFGSQMRKGRGRGFNGYMHRPILLMTVIIIINLNYYYYYYYYYYYFIYIYIFQ